MLMGVVLGDSMDMLLETSDMLRDDWCWLLIIERI